MIRNLQDETSFVVAIGEGTAVAAGGAGQGRAGRGVFGGPG